MLWMVTLRWLWKEFSTDEGIYILYVCIYTHTHGKFSLELAGWFQLSCGAPKCPILQPSKMTGCLLWKSLWTFVFLVQSLPLEFSYVLTAFAYDNCFQNRVTHSAYLHIVVSLRKVSMLGSSRYCIWCIPLPFYLMGGPVRAGLPAPRA